MFKWSDLIGNANPSLVVAAVAFIFKFKYIMPDANNSCSRTTTRNTHYNIFIDISSPGKAESEIIYYQF